MLGRQMENSGQVRGPSEEEQPFLEADVESMNNLRASRRPDEKSLTRRYSYLYSFMLVVLGSTFIISGIWYKPPEYQCVRQLNVWSPMREAITYHEVVYEPSSRAEFMGVPTPDLEDAWGALWQFGSLGIPDEKLVLLNKTSTERAWHRLPPEIGGGVQAYFEGFHHIHCLNLVRQYTYRHEYDYSYLRDFTNVKIPVLEHVEHCLEILRTKLMCDGDTTPYLAHRNTNQGTITIDTSAPRKCRNFENMVNWANSHITVPFELNND